MRDFGFPNSFGALGRQSTPVSLTTLVLSTPGIVAAFDPFSFSTLFQDEHGTTPVGVGDYTRLLADSRQLKGPETALPEKAAFNPGAWTYDAASNSYTKSAMVWAALRWSVDTPYVGRWMRLTMDVETTAGTLNVYRRNAEGTGNEVVGSISDNRSFSCTVYLVAADPLGSTLRLDSDNWTGTVKNVRLAELVGYPAIANSASQRPRLIEGDPGERWLDYDGLDDRLALPTAAASVFSGTNQWFVALAVDLDWTRIGSGSPRVFLSVATVNSQRNSMDISFSSSQQKVLVERFVNGANSYALSAVVPSGKMIVTAGWTGTQIMVGVNGVETFTADTRAMINLAAEPSVSTYFATGGFSSGVGDALIFNRFLGADERASLVDAMAERINL